jgi:hypothetical protein
MSNQQTPSVTVQPAPLDELKSQLSAPALKTQLAAVNQLVMTPAGCELLVEFFLAQFDEQPSPFWGSVYQRVLQSEFAAERDRLTAQYPDGIVPLVSDAGLDYQPLQKLLLTAAYEAADRVSMQKLCELAGPAAVQRKWLYFSEVDRLPIVDLQTINQLWLTYSEGKFGFSVQRELWLGQGRNFTKLWAKLAWKNGNQWTRYPNEFIWDLSAPPGHLPLSNQLRGVRTFEAILNHPAWTQSSS